MNEQQAQELMNTPTKPGLTLLHTVKLAQHMDPFAALAVRHVLHGNYWTDHTLEAYARRFARAPEQESQARQAARDATNDLLDQLTKAKGKVIRKWATAEDAPIAFAQLHTSRANTLRLYIREGAPAEDLQAFRAACVTPNTNGRHGPYQGTPFALRDFDDWAMDYPGTNTGRLSMTMIDANGEEHPHLVLDAKSAWIRRVGAVGTLLGKHNTWGGKQNTWASRNAQVSTLDTLIGRAKALIADDFPVADEARALGERMAATDFLEGVMYSLRSTYAAFAYDVAQHANTWGDDEWVAQWVAQQKEQAEAQVNDKAGRMSKMEDQLREAVAKVHEVCGEDASEELARVVERHNLTGVGLDLVQQIVEEVSA